MDIGTLIGLVGGLFTGVAGSSELAGIIGILFFMFLGYRLHLSADGWVVLMSGVGILFGTFYFETLGIIPIILIILGILIYFGMSKLFRR